MESNVNNPKSLSPQELDAFMDGLSFYLFSDLPETEKMEIAQSLIKDRLDNDTDEQIEA
ncbi:hypothetical protein [Microcoleus sp. FACHB-672]|uniref:hypothetical protein n=1 Tax=Microcoleus sp. FACHB-672 TaxID=2692825 RepID=UPI0016845628|nr:hypothetical protein [Microcoleus sp. FACHB-672]MBD2039223.1 hypothetical protein [Microcoleus sp. FACHB-672]